MYNRLKDLKGVFALFENEKHLSNFNTILGSFSRDLSKDVYWTSFIYVIASDNDLVRNVNTIIDFKDTAVKSGTMFNEPFLTSTTKRLLMLAYSLFTDNSNLELENETLEFSIPNIFDYLDSQNFEICFNAIKIRYNKQSIDLSSI